MSTIHTSNAARLYWRSGLSVSMVCLLATVAQAQTRSFSSLGESNESTILRVPFTPASDTHSCANRLSVSAPQLVADDQTMRTTYPNYSAPNYIPGTNQTMPNYPTYNAQTGGNSDIPPAVRRLIGPGHLPSAMQNPATIPFQGGDSAREAEHQRVLSNMRAAGYSEDRINGYNQQSSDPPGMTYRSVMGIKVRNDGMTAGQAFSNIKNSGLMNTPIHADPDYYQPGTYGYYRGHGGTKTFGQWLDDGQR